MNEDLISREALIKELEQRHLDDVFIKRGLPPMYKMSLECNRALEAQGDAIRDVITGLPAVDAVRVTRCKDCAYYEDGECFHDMQFCCRLYAEDGTPARYNFAPDAFCSYGETPEERQQREAAEQDAWESMQMMCNPEDGSL